MIIQKAIDTTLNNFKKFSRYEQFMQDATQDEFARSQIPFYFAVKAFPRALCYLASMIEEPAVRLSLAENIWEEHGNGDAQLFHINTFHQYLTAIAGKNYELSHNPWIESWIDSWFANKDIHALACQLAAIEYLYAPMSAKLAEHIETLSLHNEQAHYSKHAVLDWDHGRELFEIALHYDHSKDYERTFELFSEAQMQFIGVMNGMAILTEKEVKAIAQDPIAFYYLREDGDVALNALEELTHRETVNIITICSGGENIVRYLQSDKPMNITVLDMNVHQYRLFLDKLQAIQNEDHQAESILTELSQGKFERIFKHLRECFTEEEQNAFAKTGAISKEKLKFAVYDIFSRQNLAVIFTENAVKYTQKDFAEHFYQVFLSNFEPNTFGAQNIQNILAGKPFDYSQQPLKMENKSIMPMIHYVDDATMFDAFEMQTTDMIDLSNIGDWIDLSILQSLVQRAYHQLNVGGLLIIRKLLGDYNLKQILEKAGFTAVDDDDSSHFYEEVVVGHKHG